MPSGLVALLDDVAGIARLAAASLDDVGAAAAKAGSKAVGVVVDDAAVTPRYVTGLSPERELPIIGRIALGSLRNKLVLLLPAALLLSALAPWAITPLLMLGGGFLCFEGAEKVIEAVRGAPHDDAEAVPSDPAALERARIGGAIRTDLILSAEIMAIALASVAESPIVTQAVVLALVGVAMTAGVYGAVGVIVKMDDVGLHLARRGPAATRALGSGLVRAMPVVMAALSAIGAAAMLWVGGGILVHGMETLGWTLPAAFLHHAGEAAAHGVPVAGGVVAWIVGASGAGVIGLAVGIVLAAALHLVHRKKRAGPLEDRP